MDGSQREGRDDWGTLFHRMVRGICVLFITSVVSFSVFREVSPRQSRQAALPRAKPPEQGQSSPTPAAVATTVPSPVSTLAPRCSRPPRKVGFSDGVSTASDIAALNRSLVELLPCVQPDAGCTSSYTYPFVFFPVGCFGDMVTTRPCTLPSCLLGTAISQVARCGAQTVGSFLGDNFYPSGIRKPYDPRFNGELTEKFWRHEALRVPWYSTVGNHDQPKPQAQFRSDHPFWKMPGFRHTSPLLRVQGSTSQQKDTVVSMQLFLFPSHWGFAKNDPFMPAEAAWLDSALSNSTAQWKIVVTHEPIWGFMNFPHSKGMVEHIHPVLVKHKVRLFACAHAHSVTLHRAPGGYYQLISAGFTRDHIHDLVKPNRPVGHFHLGTGATAVLIDSDRMDIVAFDSDLRLIWHEQAQYNDHVFGEPNWQPPNASITVAGQGFSDYWKWRQQCDAFLPVVPPYCKPRL